MTALPEGPFDAVLVTGMSGAGRSTALKMLEDLGYEAVDNLPVSLLSRILPGAGDERGDRRPVAVGVDIRSRNFDPSTLSDAFSGQENRGLKPAIVFLDCSNDVLLRRYTETRRRHPLALDRPVEDGIRLERQTIRPLQDQADFVIDTSELSIWELKERLKALFGAKGQGGLSVTVESFSYRYGLPRDADIVFDARFLKNPHYDPVLRPLTGEDPSVGEAIRSDPDFEALRARLTDLISLTLPRYEQEGKSYLTIAVGCTGGRHRSVYLARMLADWIGDTGRNVFLRHRDLGVAGPARSGGGGEEKSTGAGSDPEPPDEETMGAKDLDSV